MALPFKQLQAFHAVATEVSFTRAAARLGVTQPAVTTQVTRLEQASGVRLFERRRSGPELTPAGASLLAVTRKIFRLMDDAEEALLASAGLRSGNLHLGVDSPHWSMDLLARFTETHPDVRVATTVGNATKVRDALLAAEVDAAVLTVTGDSLPEDARILRLQPQRLRLIVPQGHRLATEAPVHPRALKNQRLILREPGSATRAAFESWLGHGPRSGDLELGGRDAVREAVASGLGIGAVVAGEEGQDPRVVSVDMSDGETDASICLVALADRADSPAVAGLFRLATSSP